MSDLIHDYDHDKYRVWHVGRGVWRVQAARGGKVFYTAATESDCLRWARAH